MTEFLIEFSARMGGVLLGMAIAFPLLGWSMNIVRPRYGFGIPMAAIAALALAIIAFG